MNVLDEIVAAAHERAVELKVSKRIVAPPIGFLEAIAGRNRVSVIAEFKRRSPSLGEIRSDIDVVSRVRSYVDGGAAGLSVLTEPSRFGGSYEDLRQAVAAVDAPVLMKDFVVAESQIEMAACLGAAAVLLIVRCLTESRLRQLASACRSVGVTPLVECHDASEVDSALQIPEAVIGVNSRDLDTLQVDLERGRALLARVPADRVAVAESGVERPEQIRSLVGLADAVLVGTTLMRADRPEDFLREALS